MGLTAPSSVIGVGKRRLNSIGLKYVTNDSLCLYRCVRHMQTIIQEGFHAI